VSGSVALHHGDTLAHDTTASKYLVEDESKLGFRGLNVVRLKALLSFCYEGTEYPCAVVEPGF
jgi:hypothetical protein